MDTVQQLIELIPIRHNLVSQLMFLGVVQGMFLSLVIFKKSKDNSALIFFGLSLLCQSIVFLDTYLCYTGLMKKTLHLNDATEPLVLSIAPTFYLFLYLLIERQPVKFKKHWWHLVLPVFYTFSQIGYYTAPLSIKLNAYLGAYHTGLPRAGSPVGFDYGYHVIKDRFDWLVLFSFLVYGVLSFLLVYKEWKRKKFLPNQVKTKKYLFSRNSVVILFLVFFIVFAVFYAYDDDSGDHYIALIQTLIAFLASYIILIESRFFEKSWIADKYETLTSRGLSFDEIEHFVNKENYYRVPSASLKDLSSRLKESSNFISKTINLNTGSNFNDYINCKRIDMAKTKLVSTEYSHLTVEAIGELVGFRSKSAFYNAFKKHTGHSPSHYAKKQSFS